MEENRDLEKDKDEAKGVSVGRLPARPQVDRSKHNGLLLGLMQPTWSLWSPWEDQDGEWDGAEEGHLLLHGSRWTFVLFFCVIFF